MADQGSEGLLSPYLRRRRIAAAQPFLRGRVLDVGCGAGALAGLVPPDRYVGVDPDADSLSAARRAWPAHAFLDTMPDGDPGFDTVVSLAVIEHVPDPQAFLGALGAMLKGGAGDRIVLTTPRPAVDWLHGAGAAVGIFSSHASEEHEALLGRRDLEALARAGGFAVELYRRFLSGANQLLVLRHGGPAA